MDPAHADAPHAPPKYYSIWFILLVVTVVEVIVGTVALPKVVSQPALVIMALYKAVLVALYFMHLKFERKAMWIIAAAPLIFGVILAIGTHPDSEKGTSPFQRGDPQPWLEQDAGTHE